MSQSLCRNYLHTVFSTKNRVAFLKDAAFRARTHAYLAGICKNMDSPELIIGGVADHVHLLCRFSKNLAVADFLRDLKKDSTKWVRRGQPGLADFHWQSGYGAFSVSPSHLPALTRYIRDQEDHDRKVSYQDEFRRLCRKYGVVLDERYAWD